MTKIISSCLTKPTTYRSSQAGNVAIFSARCKIISLGNNGCSSRCQLTSRENAAADELSAAVRSRVVSSIVPFGKTTRNKRKKDGGKKNKRRWKEQEQKNRAEEERKTGANCFNVANGRQSKLKILDYLHCARSRVPVHAVYNSQAAPCRHGEKQMFRVGRLDLVTTEFRVKNPRNQWKSVYERRRAKRRKIVRGFAERQGLGQGEKWMGVGYGTSGRLSQFPDFNIDGCRARVIQCVNFRPVF